MALIDRVTARYSNTLLKQITNPDNPGASSIDTDRLQAAADDAEQYFASYTGVEYDDDNERHRAFACEGVIVILQMRKSNAVGATSKAFDAWVAQLRQFAKTFGGRDKVEVTTSSQLQPSEESEARPDADRANFDDLIPSQRSPDDDDGE